MLFPFFVVHVYLSSVYAPLLRIGVLFEPKQDFLDHIGNFRFRICTGEQSTAFNTCIGQAGLHAAVVQFVRKSTRFLCSAKPLPFTLVIRSFVMLISIPSFSIIGGPGNAACSRRSRNTVPYHRTVGNFRLQFEVPFRSLRQTPFFSSLNCKSAVLLFSPPAYTRRILSAKNPACRSDECFHTRPPSKQQNRHFDRSE